MQILDDFLENIANAIRKRKQTTALIKATDFASEIESIPQSSTGAFQTKEISITSNGETILTPDEDYDGISSATITTNVQASLQTKTSTLTSSSAISIIPDSGYDGLSKVTVTPSVQTKTATLTSASTTDIAVDTGKVGMTKVTVTPKLEAKTGTITSNGTTTYTTSSGYCGMKSCAVTVNVAKTLTQAIYHNNSSFYSGIGVTIPTGITQAKIIMSMVYPSGYNFYPQCTTTSGTISTTYDQAPANGSYIIRTTVYTLNKSSSAAATVTMKIVASESYHVLFNSGVVVY